MKSIFKIIKLNNIMDYLRKNRRHLGYHINGWYVDYGDSLLKLIEKHKKLVRSLDILLEERNYKYGELEQLCGLHDDLQVRYINEKDDRQKMILEHRMAEIEEDYLFADISYQDYRQKQYRSMQLDDEVRKVEQKIYNITYYIRFNKDIMPIILPYLSKELIQLIKTYLTIV